MEALKIIVVTVLAGNEQNGAACVAIHFTFHIAAQRMAELLIILCLHKDTSCYFSS